MTLIVSEGVESQWYAPECEENSETPTRFLIKPLTGEKLDQVMQGIVGTELSANGKSFALAYGLVDWENFKVTTNNNNIIDKPFKLQDIELIPYNIRRELAFKIAYISNLSPDNEKNS